MLILKKNLKQTLIVPKVELKPKITPYLSQNTKTLIVPKVELKQIKKMILEYVVAYFNRTKSGIETYQYQTRLKNPIVTLIVPKVELKLVFACMFCFYRYSL